MFNYRLWLAVTAHSMFGMWEAYLLAVLVNMEPFVKGLAISSLHSHYGYLLPDSSWPWCWALVNTSASLGSLLGALLLKPLISYFGRRNTVMLVNKVILLVSITLSFAASPLNSIELLVMGRFLFGMSFMVNLFLVTFATECAGIKERGRAGTAVSLAGVTWNTLAVFITLPQLLGSKNLWYYSLILPLIPTFLHVLCAAAIPQSPKGLFSADYSRTAVIKSVQWYQGKDCDTEKVLDEFAQEAAMVRGNSVTMGEILKKRHLRWPLMLVVVSWITTVVGGGTVAISYSTSFIKRMGTSQEDAALYTALIAKAPTVPISLACVIFVDRFGRRFIILSGIVLLMVGHMCILVADYVPIGGELGAVGMLLMLAGTEVAKMIASILPAELCPVLIRPLAVACYSACLTLLNLPVILVFPPLYSAVGGLVALFFFIPTLSIFATLFFFLPETKGKTVEECLAKWLPK